MGVWLVLSKRSTRLRLDGSGLRNEGRDLDRRAKPSPGGEPARLPLASDRGKEVRAAGPWGGDPRRRRRGPESARKQEGRSGGLWIPGWPEAAPGVPDTRAHAAAKHDLLPFPHPRLFRLVMAPSVVERRARRQRNNEECSCGDARQPCGSRAGSSGIREDRSTGRKNPSRERRGAVPPCQPRRDDTTIPATMKAKARPW